MDQETMLAIKIRRDTSRGIFVRHCPSSLSLQGSTIAQGQTQVVLFAVIGRRRGQGKGCRRGGLIIGKQGHPGEGGIGPIVRIIQGNGQRVIFLPCRCGRGRGMIGVSDTAATRTAATTAGRSTATGNRRLAGLILVVLVVGGRMVRETGTTPKQTGRRLGRVVVVVVVVVVLLVVVRSGCSLPWQARQLILAVV